MDNYGGSGFSGGAQYGANYVEPDPSQQIMVRNVSLIFCSLTVVVIECHCSFLGPPPTRI
jgi:hypothetical protein